VFGYAEDRPLPQRHLTTRLFLMANVFARVKGIEALVFVETARGVQRRYIGWARAQHSSMGAGHALCLDRTCVRRCVLRHALAVCVRSHPAPGLVTYPLCGQAGEGAD
jgi:hypothetical protein